jgi:glycosyltransferase involved in cell wall biosynthesis
MNSLRLNCNDSQPLVSIVTTCFNASKTIERTFQSVLDQTYANYEYWVIDAASRDGTIELVKRFQLRFGDRMKFQSEPDKGIYDGFNKGVSRCSGELIGILNADDWFEPDTLERVVAAYQSHPEVGLFYGISRSRSEGGAQELGLSRRHHSQLSQKMTGHPGVFISKCAYQKYGLYSLKYRVAADYDLMLRLQQGGVPFFGIDHILVNSCIGGDSDRMQLTGDLESAAIRLRCGFISSFRYRRLVVQAWRNHLRRSLKAYCVRLFGGGNTG